MPLFKKDKEPSKNSAQNHTAAESSKSPGKNDSSNDSIPNEPLSKAPVPIKPKLVFHCQQAQGSPTGLISGFTNVKELYEKISECYGFPMDDILYCTLNTYRVDMDHLLSAQLCLEDFIFVHRKGIKKEIEIVKTEQSLGLTITDNGTGYSFIKRIRDGSVIKNIDVIQVGDHIEKIDNESLVGWKHVDVAKYLKTIPIGNTITLRLVEPLRAGFGIIGPKSKRKQKTGFGQENYGTGKQTLRFRSNGPAVIEVVDDTLELGVSKINELLENFMGINDVDLATQIWEMANGTQNTMEFAEALDNSELESFGFSDDFVIEVWGILTDAKSRLLKPKTKLPY